MDAVIDKDSLFQSVAKLQGIVEEIENKIFGERPTQEKNASIPLINYLDKVKEDINIVNEKLIKISEVLNVIK